MVNGFSVRVPRPFTGERTVSFSDDAGTTRYPHVKEKSWTLFLLHIQKLTQMIKDLNLIAKM